MKRDIVFLGTGYALALNCYNSCFVIRNNNEYFMVDAGGGNQILKILKDTKIDIDKIHDLFVTHTHTDHVLGVIWVMRAILQKMKADKYEGSLRIFSHEKVLNLLKIICTATLPKKLVALMNERVMFNELTDGSDFQSCGMSFKAFDILSTKEKQYGFTALFEDGLKLSYLGDEPFNEHCESYVTDSDYLITEAFCLYKDRDIYKPYEKHHSTAKDAAECASKLRAKNIILFHTEDNDLKNRKETYTKEASKYFSGKVYVPDDLDVICLETQ